MKGITQAQLATPAETLTGELPASGHLAHTSTVAQSTTAMKPTLQPPTLVNALAHRWPFPLSPFQTSPPWV